ATAISGVQMRKMVRSTHGRTRFRPARPGSETLTNPSKSLEITQLLESTRVENLSRSSWVAGRSLEKFDAVAEGSQFADHLARASFLRLCTDDEPAFLVAHAFVENLPDQTAQAVSNGADRLGMSEARDDTAIHHGKDRPLGLHGGVRGLIEDATHLAVAFGA